VGAVPGTREMRRTSAVWPVSSECPARSSLHLPGNDHLTYVTSHASSLVQTITSAVSHPSPLACRLKLCSVKRKNASLAFCADLRLNIACGFLQALRPWRSCRLWTRHWVRGTKLPSISASYDQCL